MVGATALEPAVHPYLSAAALRAGLVVKHDGHFPTVTFLDLSGILAKESFPILFFRT